MPRARDIIIRLARLLVRIFFRSVEVEGLEHVPRDGGGIIVSWHPNALVDPVLILACMPRPVVFGARSGLFRWPLLGWLMRSVGTVPIHRTQDRADLSPEDRHAANLRSLDALAKAVADGGFSCLFPEGDSHDAPHLLAIKTGAARFYYRARLLRPDGPPPAIIPVGLHYDAKRKFRSEVLVRFHPPLELPPSMDVTPTPDEAPDRARGRVRQLTASIEQVLREVVHATESWELHHHMHRASKLLRAERAKRAGAELGRPSMLEREVGFWRMWAGYHRWRELEPELTQELVDRVARYEEKLRALGMEDHELDRSPTRGRWHRAGLLIAQVITAFVVFPSLIFLAGAVNLGPYLIIRYGSRMAARKGKDHATIKLAAGVVLYPIAWSVAAVMAAGASFMLHEVDPLIPAAPVQAAIVVVLLSVAGGAAGIHYLRLVRETARALRVRITRARQRVALAELRVERSELADLLERSEEGVDLPGAVTAQGKVIASEQVPPGGKM
jgi:glycerol-3-phosphate O-acyltransferase/dihydroxyacetone phosphate acyltransferase